MHVILISFSTKTGIPFSRYKDYEDSMTGFRSRWFDSHLIQDFIPTVTGIHEKLGNKKYSLVPRHGRPNGTYTSNTRTKSGDDL